MGQTKNYIELNGKRYNASTGELITSAAPAKAAVKPAAKAVAKTSASAGKAIDSFRHPSAKAATKSAPAKAAKAATKPVAAKAAATVVAKPATKPAAKPVMDVRRAPASHLTRRKQQHSQTLMRKSVKRPSPGIKRIAKTQTRTDILAKVPAQQIAPKLSIRKVDEKRLKRATGVSKSQLVSHFGAPAAKPAPKPTTKPAVATTKLTPKPSAKLATANSHDVRPVYAASAAATAPRQASMDIFEQALARANSHKETTVDPKKLARTKKKKANRRARRIVSSVAAAMAVLVIGGFIALQNTANLKMHLASNRAGVHATLPGHKPSGFAAVKFNYGKGFVTVDYHNTANGQDYQVTQTASNWNSDALYNEYVAATAGKNYDTVRTGGRTIYTYGNHNATWVDGGIWYNITSDGALNQRDLIDVATSM